MGKYRLNGWVLFWFYLSFLVVLWDASYILFRPMSMAGGSLEHIWGPYQTYIQADKRYADMTDGFGIAQSWMNLVEVLVGVWALYKHHTGDSSCILYAFATSLMTAAKTACYFLTEICSGFEYTGHSLASGDHFTFWVSFVLPSAFWLVIPTWISLVYGCQIASALRLSPASTSSKSKTR